MKKLSLYAIIALFCFANVAFAESIQKRSRNTIKIMSGVTIAASGTSTYIIDLKNPAYWPIVYGAFSLQFSGVTCGYEDPATGKTGSLSGATINVAYRQSNRLPSGTNVIKGMLTGTSEVTSNLESINIVTDLAYDSGNTEYVYEFFPEKCRYLVMDVTAGATTMVTTVYIDMD